MAKNFNMEMNIAKAIGIVTIVACHTGWDISGDFFPCSSWHVPLFFFISGYFFKPELFQNTNILIYTKSIIRKYFSRFYAYHIFYGGITWIVYVLFDRIYGQLPDLKTLTVSALDSFPFHLCAANWFLGQLGLSLLFFTLVMLVMKKITAKNIQSIFIFLSLAIIAIFLANNNFEISYGLKRMLIRTLLTSFYIYTGYLYKNNFEKNVKFDMKNICLILTLQTSLHIIFEGKNGMDINQSRIWHNISPLIAPFTGIYCILFLSKLLAPLVKPGTLIDKIGRNTLHIMANHLFIIFLIEICILAIDGKSIDTLPQYIINSFYKMEKYKYLYTFLSVIICAYLGETLNYTEKIIKNKITNIKAKNQIPRAPSGQLHDVPKAP